MRMTILQGLPGSGKSTKALMLAEESLKQGLSAVILSTDQFFMQEGKYVFEPRKIPEAHQWNQGQAHAAVGRTIDHVIIDNTNMQGWEAKPYVLIAKDHGYEVEFAQAGTPWADDPTECQARCTHGVPLASIVAMQGRKALLTVEGCMMARAPWDNA